MLGFGVFLVLVVCTMSARVPSQGFQGMHAPGQGEARSPTRIKYTESALADKVESLPGFGKLTNVSLFAG